MSSYLNTLEAAFYLFPVIAALITLPYLIYANRRYNGIPFLRAFVFYTFILYLTCCYVLVIFPLPSAEELAQIGSKTMDLRFLGFVQDLQAYSSFVLSDPSTWLASLREQVAYQVFFNLIMLIPFGIYMHYYFRKGFFWTLLLGFMLSLSFELIQLSALFGLYPHPYRLFQIDDLLLNTTGAGIGWIVSPMISWMFPSQQKLNQISQGPRSEIEPYRRITAFLADFFLMLLCMNLVSRLTGLSAFSVFGESRYFLRFLAYAVSALLYFAGLSFLFGATPGKMIFGLRIVTQDRRRPSFEQLLIRYALELLVALPAPFLAVKVYQLTDQTNSFIDAILFMITAIFMIFFAVFAFQILISLFTGKMMLFTERLSGTGIVSSRGESGRKKARSPGTAGEASRPRASSGPDGRRPSAARVRPSSPDEAASRTGAAARPQGRAPSAAGRRGEHLSSQDTAWLYREDPYGRDSRRQPSPEDSIFREEPLQQGEDRHSPDEEAIFRKEDSDLVMDDVSSHFRERRGNSGGSSDRT